MLFRTPQILATMVAKKTGFPVFFYQKTYFQLILTKKHLENTIGTLSN
jgi:hypothetical protein